MTFRSANDDPALLDVARDLFRRYQAGLGIDLCFQGFESELAELPGAYAHPRGELLIAFADESPAGCGAVRPIAEGIAEIKRMYLVPNARGSGNGRALLHRLVQEARDRGYHTVKLDTLARLTPAVRLYQNYGFRSTVAYNHNPEADILYFELDLTDSRS